MGVVPPPYGGCEEFPSYGVVRTPGAALAKEKHPVLVGVACSSFAIFGD